MTSVIDTTTDEVGLDLVTKLTKDIKATATSLDRQEASYLVNIYYRLQEHREAMGNQVSSLEKAGRPDVPVLSHFYVQMRALERQMVGVLGTWAASRPEGAWAQEQKGIGPVLSAALSAYIDITVAPTAGSIWRFAGLDSTTEWIGRTGAKEVVDGAFAAEDTDAAAVYWLSRALNRHVEDIYSKLGFDVPAREWAQERVSLLAGVSVEEIFAKYPIRTDNAILHACQDTGIDPRQVYEDLYKGLSVNKDALRKLLAKRPYNADLKVICWKIGDCLCKVSGKPDAYYGQIYKQRKIQEVQKNEAGAFADQAAASLVKRKISDATLRKCYESGKLPPGRLELRARRYAVKLLLAHWHAVAYQAHFGTAPPKPYPIAYLGHTHLIDPPGHPGIYGDDMPSQELGKGGGVLTPADEDL